MITLAAFTAVLVGPLGVAALAIFALIAVRPAERADVRRAHAPGRASRSADGDAALLARAGAAPRPGPRTSAATSPGSPQLAFERRADAGDPIAYARQTIRDPSRASWEAGHVGEWWNGGGGPAGLRGPVTPVTSRIVAVADTWSALTAKGGPQLSHAEALVELENAAGTRFDPRVVQAAHAVVAEERVSEAEPAPEPRLHPLRLPGASCAALMAAS